MDMICTAFSFQNPYTFPLHTAFSKYSLLLYASLCRTPVFGILAQILCDIYSSIGCALSSFRSPLGPPFDFLFDTCSCQTARCFNKSKGVLITGSKLKAFRNPSLAGGFLCTKTASKPAVNACMDRFVFCFYANRHFPALITDR